jgi:hypothetical protein
MDKQPGRFIRLCDRTKAFDDDELAQELGRPFGPMHSSGQGGNPKIPAGFTYLGQFIDHDLSFDPNMSLEPKDNVEDEPRNFRAAAFDLDSIYGLGPSVHPYLYDSKDRRKFLLGGNHNDLPRLGNVAVTADPRNDEHVIMTKLVTAFLNFHNEVVDRLNQSFSKTQQLVRQHYQWIALYEYLPTIVGRPIGEILKDVERLGHPDRAAVPLEFSVAAFRFGHSQIRGRYDINSDVQGKSRRILPDLAGHRRLTPLDRVEWSFFFDMGTGQQPQPSLPIRPFLSPPMLNMPPQIVGNPRSRFQLSAAYRDLRRAQVQGLPDARTAIQKLKIPKDQIISDELIWSKVKRGLERSRSKYDPYGKPVPLWLYILFEAQELAEGQRLGPLGAQIISAVFIGLMKADSESILSNPDWKPTLGENGRFGIADLLRMAEAQKARFAT